MAFSLTCLILQRLLLPTVLVLTALFRPVGISFVYLLMFFISPFIPVATSRNFKGKVSAYLIILIALTTLLILCHITLQIIILTVKETASFGDCSFTEQLLRHIGFVDLRHLGAWAIVEWLAPEVLVFITSLAVYLTTKKLAMRPAPKQIESGEVDTSRDTLENGNEANVLTSPTTSLPVYADDASNEVMYRLIKISPLFCLAALFFAAILRPSVPGGLYFVFFLLSGSWWALFKSLQRGFAALIRFLGIIIVVHALAIVTYQLPWVQDHLSTDHIIARLIGLEALAISSCKTDIRIITFPVNMNWDSYLNPIALLFSYYVLILSSKNLLNPKLMRHGHKNKSAEPSETAVALEDIHLDPTEQVNVKQTESNASILDQIYYGFVSVGGFIYQNSYIFTNIMMMTWSIVYHSWLTFVLLLWANVLWMIPNQRKAMIRSSPFVAIYAEFLLLAQYVYGLNLTNSELPSYVETAGVNLKQIGLQRPQDTSVKPCVPLMVKTTFLLMFWVTCRQFFKEKLEKREGSIGDMARNLGLTSTTYDQTDAKTSKFLKKTGDVIKNLLVRLWIWLLVLVIFLCATTGDKMTGFRICYMAMFLFFLLVFQTSSTAWVRIMYGFWLFLIFYAMSILILVYTYQFDKFKHYWEIYLNISEALQSDIGLKQYYTKDLFLHLLLPTIIVILTVIQVHYFHKRFIDALQQPPIRPSDSIRRSIHSKRMHRNDSNPMQQRTGDFPESVKDLMRISYKKAKSKLKRTLRRMKSILWRFLELHIIKVVYITAFLCAVDNICFLHIPFVVLCLVGVISRSKLQIFISRIISVMVSIIILTKMMYQVKYIDDHQFDIKCTYVNVSDEANMQVYAFNNAVWFGLNKATVNLDNLMDLLKKYIIYMIMVTLHAVVTLRQTQARTIYGTESNPVSRELFPGVTRWDAEKNLKSMVKYLFNYGFFRFGVEISLIVLVVNISYRQDIVALLYTFWLILLLTLSRRRKSHVWGVFQWFIAICIFLQFILVLDFPPSLCLMDKYIWNRSIYSEPLQRWAMLPGPLRHHHVSKLIFDFILLLIVNRQKRVFYIEHHIPSNTVFPGGTNSSVVKDIENLGRVPFENPTRDFLSHIRNYLDIFKNAVLCGFYWISLGVVFLAGTAISDILAIGYLVGAFYFLWQGSDIYLHPIRTILRRWGMLLAYNVFNIVIKTSMQLAGCLFLTQLEHYACWLVHVLSISCSSASEEFLIDHSKDHPDQCPVITASRYLIWDAICFAFLILQFRIFRSHYFCHIILDTKANSILASRGAEIIEDLRQKQIVHRLDHESEVLMKIKRKMEKIRAAQQKLLPKPLDRPSHHADEHDYPIHGTRVYKRKNIKFHPEAVRSGDYYMFEDVDDKFELDVIDDQVDFLDNQEQIQVSEKKMTRRKNLIETKGKDQEQTDTQKDAAVLDETDVYASTSKKKHVEGRESAKPTIDEKDSEEDIDSNPIVRLLEAFLVTITMRLNRFSRNYRYVNMILAEEKKSLKESYNFYSLGRAGAHAMFTLMKRNTERDEHDGVSLSSASSSASSRINSNTSLHNTNNPHNVTTITNVTNISTPTETIESPISPQTTPMQPTQDNIVDIIDAPLDTVDARLEPVVSVGSSQKNTAFDMEEDDFTSREHHIIIEMLIAAWYAILSNTDLICYIVVFINQVANASIISLPLPLMIFLWGTLSLPRPTKTFWVTLIAYTQAVVLIKCIFEYKLIWGNYVNHPNQPLSTAKIFGVEIAHERAKYDLLLLLVLFLHRYILKAQGLWKSDYKEDLIVLNSGENEANDKQTTDSESAKPSLEQPSPSKRIADQQTSPISERSIHSPSKTSSILSAINDDNLNRPSLELYKTPIATSSENLIADRNDQMQTSTPERRAPTNLSAEIINERENADAKREKAGAELKLEKELMKRALTEPQEVETSNLSKFKDIKRRTYQSACCRFFINLVHKERLPADVYALMFFCDFINFFVLLFGFTAFGSKQIEGEDTGVQTYLAENKVPVPFLIMLLVQFILIVIDRALYLRKALTYKIIFHFFTVVGIHIWMFFIVPAVTERSFYSLAPPIIYYIIKCFYLLLSAYQIKCGYPKRVLGNFLTRGFSLVNMIFFKIYMQIPFLYELRTVLDWVCTDTTMTMFDWLKMEDIFADIYFIKCSRTMETDFPALRAEKKALFSKLMVGGTIVVLIVVAIWGPLCLFALFNAVGISNLPYEVSLNVRIGSYDPIYSTNNRESITGFEWAQYEKLKDLYAKDSTSTTFLQGYDMTDVAAVHLAGNAPTLWNISPPDRKRLLDDLINNVTLTARFSYGFHRTPPSKGMQSLVGDEITVNLNSSYEYRKNLIDLLNGTATSDLTVVLPNMVPKFIKVLNSGEVAIVPTLMRGYALLRPLVLKMRFENGTEEKWWEISDYCYDEFYNKTLSQLPQSKCDSGVTLYTFSDRTFPSTFSFLTAGGIMGLYTTLVFIASRFLKAFMAGQSRRIMFEDLPYVDRVLQLCLDIYLVREALEFALEEDLFAKLIFLYRSPETMIKWTRPREELLQDDETDSESVRSVRRTEAIKQ